MGVRKSKNAEVEKYKLYKVMRRHYKGSKSGERYSL